MSTTPFSGPHLWWWDVQTKSIEIFDEACTVQEQMVQMTCEKVQIIEDGIKRSSWSMEAERDGLRIALSVQIDSMMKEVRSFSSMNNSAIMFVNTTGFGGTVSVPAAKVWTPTGIEILVYDNESGLDQGYLLGDPLEAMSKLRELGEWLVARRRSFWSEEP